MTKRTAILLVILSFLAVSAAGQNRLSGKWRLTSMTDENGTEITLPEKPKFTIEFQKKSLLTARACNIISGKFSAGKRSIRITLTRSTAMACPELPTELIFTRSLKSVTGFSIENNEVVLTDAKNKVSLRFGKM